MDLHPLLHRHLKKYHQNGENFEDFIQAINKTFLSFERDREITEHAFEVSEKEYQRVLKSLKSENELKVASILKMKQALIELAPSDALKINESDDLIEIIELLQKQISIRNELRNTLIQAKVDAEKAAKAKSDFLSVMSHEIRTPMNSIIGNVHILKQEESLPSQNEFIEMLHISSQNLLNLVNDILDFSKIEEGKVHFNERPIHLRELLSELKATNSFTANENENEIVLDLDNNLPELVFGDAVRFNQVMNNLISNALKFTSKGKVIIQAKTNSETEDMCFIDFAVKDNGIGIKEEDHDKIFTRFSQVNSENNKQFGGSGLGLAIIKQLLNIQGTDIKLESILGKGSRFYFTLAMKKNKETDTKEVRVFGIDQPNSLAGIKVLLVEDVKFNVIVAKKMMQNWGIVIDLAENGKIAVDKVLDNTYDVILMDLQMPVMDGLEAAREIRKLGSQVPIIALTASVSLEAEKRVMDSGMNDYLTKPFNPKDLFAAIQNAVLK
jgi:signal transduction histidine kinase/CheY-like chemotaxis protein